MIGAREQLAFTGHGHARLARVAPTGSEPATVFVEVTSSHSRSCQLLEVEVMRWESEAERMQSEMLAGARPNAWDRRRACLHHPSLGSLNGECWPPSTTAQENSPQTMSETGATPVPLHGYG